MDDQSPDYRAGELAGRTRAVTEMTDLVNRLSLNVQPELGPEVSLGTLVSNWLEVVAWRDQASQEAEDELHILAAEQA